MAKKAPNVYPSKVKWSLMGGRHPSHCITFVTHGRWHVRAFGHWVKTLLRKLPLWREELSVETSFADQLQRGVGGTTQKVPQNALWATRAPSRGCTGTLGETSFWRNGTPMMLMMPGAGAEGG